ncbi:sugar transferase [Acidimicrobiia bacterium]|jgi:lipopolysaccharide/colanic/teichoic acid biosynthesis glycosyltransferase|nr:sugar transferase [Acidimicrobiia bacterium]
MPLNKLAKYIFRFLILQGTLSVVTIYFFDNYLVWNQEFKEEIYRNIVEDKNRLLPFIQDSYISVDGLLLIIIFVFLVILYSTNFYTYVNELSFSMSRNRIGEFFQLYLLWTSYIFVAFFVFRFNNLFRGGLIIFSFIVPIILMFFRNTEFLSSLLGRTLTDEAFISFNLENTSKFRNLRILTFRKNRGNFTLSSPLDEDMIIESIDAENKKENINLIVLNLSETSLGSTLEKYLINLNKKILLISDENMQFDNNFIYRSEILEQKYLTYFNNDIQYGSKYILKRMMDIFFSFAILLITFPVVLFISGLIYIKDGRPIVIKQDRVGLHGKQFKMFKFRSMVNNSHSQRNDLRELNKGQGPLFKIQNDPRIIPGINFIRELSLDELPQLLNVIKGEMSLVGPRPLFNEDTKTFDKNYMRRLNVIPGITGLLQINDRNTSDFKVWYKYDMEYIENWSLILDLQIILKTPFAIFSNKIKGI